MNRRFDDEERIGHRPRKANSRRRSKDRPDWSDAQIGQVTTIDRGRITVAYPANVSHTEQTKVICVKARELGRKGVVVGDLVRLVGDLSGKPDSLARLVEVIERTTVLRRTADDIDPVERIIVANADQLAIVVAIADPPPRTGLIDRALIAAIEADLDPLLIITKTDRADPTELISTYRAMELKCLPVNQATGVGIDEVRAAFADRTTVLLGHSGVGKSTLVNSIIPDANRLTGEVNDVTGRGKHTSVSAIALALPDNTGWVIDTPGVRSFGLAHVTHDDVVAGFPEFADGVVNCPRACTHALSDASAAPECALDDWVRDGKAGTEGAARLISLRRLIAAL